MKSVLAGVVSVYGPCYDRMNSYCTGQPAGGVRNTDESNHYYCFFLARNSANAMGGYVKQRHPLSEYFF